jgi:hypothetical protein
MYSIRIHIRIYGIQDVDKVTHLSLGTEFPAFHFQHPRGRDPCDRKPIHHLKNMADESNHTQVSTVHTTNPGL